MKTSTIVWVVLAIIVILGLGWWVFAQNGTQMPAEQTANTSNTNTTSATTTDTNTDVSVDVGTTANTAPMSATVTLTASGFSPSSVTITKGGTVTFVNQTSGGMWVGADAHPTHTEYDGTSRTTHCAAGYSGPKPFDQCTSGSSYSFTFKTTGSFMYHNHMSASQMGTVVVQ